MTVTRTGQAQEAIMAIGLDGRPEPETLEKIPKVPGIIELTIFSEKKIGALAWVQAGMQPVIGKYSC